jgi:hypothetical protein
MSSFSWVCTLTIVWRVLFFTCTNVLCLREKKGVMCILSHEKTICANWPIEWSSCQSLGFPSFELWNVGFWCSLTHFLFSSLSHFTFLSFGLTSFYPCSNLSLSLLLYFITLLIYFISSMLFPNLPKLQTFLKP